MTYALWRNGEHLGDIVWPLPTSRPELSVAGVFVPTAALQTPVPIMQVRLPPLPGSPVFETSNANASTPRPIELTPLHQQDVTDVPMERILEVRNADGIALPTHMISLRQLPTPPHGHPNVVADACAAAGLPYSPWYLHAAWGVRSDAREV